MLFQIIALHIFLVTFWTGKQLFSWVDPFMLFQSTTLCKWLDKFGIGKWLHSWVGHLRHEWCLPLNLLPHSLQGYGFSPVWVCSWKKFFQTSGYTLFKHEVCHQSGFVYDKDYPNFLSNSYQNEVLLFLKRWPTLEWSHFPISNLSSQLHYISGTLKQHERIHSWIISCIFSIQANNLSHVWVILWLNTWPFCVNAWSNFE